MKFCQSILTIIIIILIFSSGSLMAFVEIGGTISSDTTWTNTDTIKVTSTVTVASSAQLTIQAGSTILFNLSTALYINGQLIAEGEQSNKILFTTNSEETWGTPVAGSWEGICYNAYSTGYLRHCNISYPYYCVRSISATIEFYDCILENFLIKGFYIDGGLSFPPIPSYINRCTIRQTEASLQGTGTGIYVYRASDIEISHSRVSNCRNGIEFFSYKTYAPNFQVNSCEIRDNYFYGLWAHVGG